MGEASIQGSSDVVESWYGNNETNNCRGYPQGVDPIRHAGDGNRWPGGSYIKLGRSDESNPGLLRAGGYAKVARPSDQSYSIIPPSPARSNSRGYFVFTKHLSEFPFGPI